MNHSSNQAVLLLTLLLPGLLLAPGIVAAQDDDNTTGFERLLQDGIADGLPGVTLLVSHGGEIIYSDAAGVAKMNDRTPLQTTDRARIFSIAKTFTALVVLQLVDEGIISLDDTVADWLDDPAAMRIPNVDEITVRQLLNHTGGVYDYADAESLFWVDAFLGPDADWAKVWTPQELLGYADAAIHAPYFAPGQDARYSNTGYILLGLIVEAATGNAFGDELQRRILEPLALHDTFLTEGGTMPEGTTPGYQIIDGNMIDVSGINLSTEWTAGGMVSTTVDLNRFARAVFTGELLSAESFAEMFTFVPTDRSAIENGLGVYRIETANGQLVGMDGQGAGAESSMMRLPEADLTVILLTNVAPRGEIVEPLRDDAFRVALGTARPPQATPVPGRTPSTTSVAIPDIVAGTPVGRQLAWILGVLNDGAQSFTAADVTTHFTPTFLAGVPPELAVALTQQIAARFGPLTFEGFTRPPTPTQANALLMGKAGTPLVVPIAVEEEEPHRITGMNFLPAPPPPGLRLTPVVDTLGTPVTTEDRRDSLVDIGDRRLHLTCQGAGSPTVVLESGHNDSAAPWSAVEQAVAGFTRVCSYDRANALASASDPAPTPRTGADVVADLHALLAAAGEPGPYVLVGHSLGGVYARLYASEYPGDVAGLVLVDASHEDQLAQLETLVTPEQWAAFVAMIEQSPDFEGIDLAATFAAAGAARRESPLSPMPLFVVTAGQPAASPFLPPDWPLDAEAALWQELQTDLATLVPNARHVIAEQSTHYVHQTEPELVVAAVRQVVAAVRDPRTWEVTSVGTPAP